MEGFYFTLLGSPTAFLRALAVLFSRSCAAIPFAFCSYVLDRVEARVGKDKTSVEI